jgi:serine phosphatase RsbU (regulator of sigma subunit)
VSSGDDILGQALRASHQMEPADLVAVLAEGAKAIGAREVALLVVDYDQRLLVPLPGSEPDGEGPVAIDGTVAGRAFIGGAVVESHFDGGVRLWFPLVDGSERLGVVSLVVDDATGRVEQGVFDLVSLVADTLQAKRAYTDAYERVRRQREMTLASELLWSLLPPLTVSTRRLAVAGILEPAYEFGGDAFDYAVNGDTVDAVVIDAMGHGMAAVVPAVVTLAALRRARRRGLGLEEMYAEADRAVRDHVGGEAFVTAQLARMDVTTGVVSWVNAGHPCPMLVRDGHVSEVPTCEPSMPLGLGGVVEAVGELALQPWDRLVFFTDGGTEGRRPREEMFGEERLADVRARESLAGHGVAETLRRTAHAVLAHHAHELLDDFTLVAVEYRADKPDAAEPPLGRRAEHDTSF